MYPERKFSTMNAKWMGDLVRVSVHSINLSWKSTFDFEMKCIEFHEFAMSNRELLSAAANGQNSVTGGVKLS
jgi:hypothetical protein